MVIEQPEASGEGTSELLNQIAGVLAGLRKVAVDAHLEQVVKAIDAALGETVAIAMDREEQHTISGVACPNGLTNF